MVSRFINVHRLVTNSFKILAAVYCDCSLEVAVGVERRMRQDGQLDQGQRGNQVRLEERERNLMQGLKGPKMRNVNGTDEG